MPEVFAARKPRAFASASDMRKARPFLGSLSPSVVCLQIIRRFGIYDQSAPHLALGEVAWLVGAAPTEVAGI